MFLQRLLRLVLVPVLFMATLSTVTLQADDDLTDEQLHAVMGIIVNFILNDSPTLQYASVVLGFSSQYSANIWSAKQVLGASNVTDYGDEALAWAPRLRNDGLHFISVGFPKAVFSTGVTIRENYGNGFVKKIEVIDKNNVLHQVWAGTDNSEEGNVVNFTPTWQKTTFLVQGVKITIDTDHSLTTWEEIDSIILHGL